MKNLITIIIVLMSVSIGQAQTSTQAQSGKHKIKVEEVIQTSTYTYIRAEENGTSQWMAMPVTQLKVGEIYYYQAAAEMKQFESKSLKRTFESILFVNGVISYETSMESGNNKSGKTEESSIQKVTPAEGAVTLAELFKNKNFFNELMIKVTGKVTKFNADIMKTNWVHLQDGTGFQNDSDLTVTTDEKVSVGDIVTFEGKLVLDQDFGYGYFYKVLLTEAKLKE